MKQAARISEDEDWTELDDLVAEQIVVLAGQRRSAAQPRLAEAAEDIEPAAAVLPEDEQGAPEEEIAAEAPKEGDEERYFALCRLLGSARDPRRLIERLVADLPPPPAKTVSGEPGRGEVANEG